MPIRAKLRQLVARGPRSGGTTAIGDNSSNPKSELKVSRTSKAVVSAAVIPSPDNQPNFAPISRLWDEAWARLESDEPALVGDYRAYIDRKAVENGAKEQSTADAPKGQQQHDLIQAMIDGIDKNAWKLKYRDHQLALKDLVDPVVGVIDWAKDYVGEALEPSPIGSVAWTGVCLLLPLVLNPGTQEAARVKGLEKIARILAQSKIRENLYYRRYESSPNSMTHEFTDSHMIYRDALKDLYVSILMFQATCVIFLAKNVIQRNFLEIIKWTGWEELATTIQAHEDAFMGIEKQWRDVRFQEECEKKAARHEESLKHLDALGSEIARFRQEVYASQSDMKRGKLLKWLSMVDPSTNYDAARKKHETNTGLWLIEATAFKTWKSAPSSFLWLHGKAGAGKSILSSCIIKYLDESHKADPYTATIYFYYSFSDLEKQSPSNMLRSLIRQLCSYWPGTPQAIFDLQQTQDAGRQPSQEELLNMLKSLAREINSVYIVVDALDECPPTSGRRQELLDVVNLIISWKLPNIHLLVTSRPENDIRDGLEQSLTLESLALKTSSSVDLLLNKAALDRDIETFVDSQFSHKRFSTWSADEKVGARESLIKKADGMFQYVALQMAALRETESIEEANAVIEDLPDGLQDTYNRMLAALSPKNRAKALRALKWLVGANRALTVSELSEASVVDPDSSPPFDRLGKLRSETGILNILPSLVTIADDGFGSTGDKVIKLAHFSIEEFLTDRRDIPGQETMLEFAFSLQDANLHIASSCLSYHIFASDADFIKTEPSRWFGEFPLWRYTSQQWMKHLNSVPAAEWPPQIKEKATKVLVPKSELFLQMIRVSDNDRFDSADPYLEMDALPTPLYYAASDGLMEICSLLLANETTDINAVTGIKGTALNAACAWGKVEIVKLLLAHNASPWIGNPRHPCAIAAAVRIKQPEIMELLLSHDEGNTDPIERCAKLDYSPLWELAARGNTAVLRLFLERGADPNFQKGSNSMYEVPLIAAAHSGQLETANLLLEYGADVNFEAGHFGTALQAAALADQLPLVERLIEAGANVNAESGTNWNALHAAVRLSHYSIVKVLLKAGADINARGVLTCKTAHGDASMAQILREAGAPASLGHASDDDDKDGGGIGNDKDNESIGGDSSSDENDDTGSNRSHDSASRLATIDESKTLIVPIMG